EHRKTSVFCDACQEGGAFGKKHLLCHSLVLPHAAFRLFQNIKKKLIGRGAHLAVPLIGLRDCV
ncbi:hypothetical protein, partial [Plesiomonas shigelloides]|uniref:hypothetical protein n=1 Tax=Plesiomonas shigelloides TaxID=703 RepID=UPI00387EF059